MLKRLEVAGLNLQPNKSMDPVPLACRLCTSWTKCAPWSAKCSSAWRWAGLSLQPQILVVTRLIPEAQGTTCDQRIEAINGTKHARILRVPFRDKGGRVVPQWMSR